ncbi:hypothetical protein ASPSYDRAFT_158161 [Aspergillus sydowii CBS 593.65]|uniref:Uncharacterized protein n=1 Tax=Aspergillus sydowii CBS 593.65 TaxID=1036612 RepID=A0A1L9T815_9EURO|nr:uncharacterized protein ASPSYDRAFT_158161 [Aspergillus sydowii CBS 593.65]OJJ55569.1 hypothetical protein ASPSYDRAFT_158161 [Aspergillus sydowii CBS 593.65]
MPPKQQPPCPHDRILYTPSPHAAQVNYNQPSKQERQDATKPAPSSSSSKRKPLVATPPTRTDIQNFPAPLVLPGDDLALDPEYPAQSFQEWLDEEERNPVTPRRKTIYFIDAPGVDSRISEVESWTSPNVHDLDSDSDSDPHSHSASDAAVAVEPPATKDVTDYLAAFFNGLPVKHLNMPKGRWIFTPWVAKPVKQTSTLTLKHIALATPKEQIRIRTRTGPDGLYSRQLNLDDLLDVAIAILPKDAYALCMLVNHDLYEDDEDSFVCGRAYGGSRVAVVSAARYNPALDTVQGVERGHAWPGAHCGGFVDGICSNRRKQTGKKMGKGKGSKGGNESTAPTATASANREGPLEDAMDVLRQSQSHSLRLAGDGEAQWQSALWLWRVIRTTSHELCHCLGLDHCVYYACIMQGSASLSEDTRQPPYLCPVDLAKVLCATGSGVKERDRALLAYCECQERRGFVYLRAFAAWLRASLGRGNGVESNQIVVIDD